MALFITNSFEAKGTLQHGQFIKQAQLLKAGTWVDEKENSNSSQRAEEKRSEMSRRKFHESAAAVRQGAADTGGARTAF